MKRNYSGSSSKSGNSGHKNTCSTTAYSNRLFDHGRNNSPMASTSNKGAERTSGGNQNRKKWRKKQHNHRSQHKTAREQDETSNDIEIPGFYYDPEKKRYFKIQPNHSQISSTVTRETIQKKQKEEKRQKDLSQSGASLNVPNLLYPYHSVSKRNLVLNGNLPHLLYNLSIGLSTTEKMDKIFQHRCIANSGNKPQCVKDVVALDQFSAHIENMQQSLIGVNGCSLLGLWTEKDSLLKRLKLLTVTECCKISEKETLPINITAKDGCEIDLWSNVNNICWVDTTSVDEPCILFTTMSYTGDMTSTAIIRKLNTERSSSSVQDFNLGNKCTWTCAWNAKGNNFSVGTQKCALVIDVTTRRMWEFHTNNSDPLTQVFATQSCNYLYSGTRRNQIVTHDLRSVSSRPVFCLSQRNSVCSLKTLQDEYKLLASDVSGKVCLWDTRARKVLVDYKGISNQYLQIPIHVDKRETTVYGVDKDGYTRFWCLQSGELLKCLPPPSDDDYIPAVAYSEEWGGRRGNAGLIMGLGHLLYLYPIFQGINS